MSISKQQIEEVKNRVDIFDFISQYVTLNSKGNSLCPFLDHNDSNASFSVSKEKQIFKCFGSCERSGNVYTFLMNYKNINFVQAVKEVAKYAGVEIQEEKKDNLSSSIYDLYDNVLKEFWGDPTSFDYFIKRGISLDICYKFRLGYCNDSNHYLFKYNKQYEDIVIKESKLFYEDGKCAFHDRYVFPLIDVGGNIIGFCGKSLDKNKSPYKNSSDSSIYNKSEFLYGLWNAQESIRKKDYVIITEGNFDCLSMYEKGFTNTVAICGTALTKQHTKLLSRYTKNAILFLDGDDAGRKAIYNSYASLINSGFKVWIINTPEKQDPDSLDKDTIIILLKDAHKLIPYMKRQFGKQADNSYLIEYIRKIAEKIDDKSNRGLFISDMAKELDISKNIIYDESILRKKKKDIDEFNKEHLLLAGIIIDKGILKDAYIKKYKFKGKFSKQFLMNICMINKESDLYNNLEKQESDLMSKIILLSRSGLTPQFVISSLQYDEYHDKIRRLLKQIKYEEQDGGDTIIIRKDLADMLNGRRV